MFARIRWHLVWWNVLVVGLILGTLGTVLYLGTTRDVMEELDRDLAGRADQAAGDFRAIAERGAGAAREGFQGGVFYLLIAADGRVLVNPQNVDLAGLGLPSPPMQSGSYATLALRGEPVRLYATAARPPDRSGPPKPELPAGAEPRGGGPRFTLGDLQGATVVTGTSLTPVQSANRSLALFLLGGSGVGLLLSFAGAWFLAGRSMGPIQEAFRRQQEFVSDASHELRTPLTIVRSATDLLYQELDAPLRQNVDLIDEVREEIDRLQRLIGDLLTLARSDRGQLVLELAPLNARVMAAEAVRRLGPLAQQRGVAVAVNAPEPAPTVEADPDRLRQVLLILLDNALKHTPAGGRVDVNVRPEERHVTIEVADTGSGIAPEHLPRLFERFYRADAARTREEGGTGLGLAIAKTLVDAHGGELSATSIVGEGTKMVVRLPTEPRESPGALRRLVGGRSAWGRS
jgi:signal transduction histidine kinase